MDKRWQQLGELLVNYSVAVRPGERVMIAMGEAETLPLVQTVYAACIKAGAFPQMQFLSETLRHALLKYGNQEQLSWLPEIEAYGMAWADVYIGLRGAHNLYELADVPADRLSLNQRTQGKISTMRWQKTRWCLVRVPNAALPSRPRPIWQPLLTCSSTPACSTGRKPSPPGNAGRIAWGRGAKCALLAKRPIALTILVLIFSLFWS